ncbi:Transmembrane protein 131 [Acipenser ruthenus]|uniref:Transmembrane protein 131 n=1 Tax=Acipenser ruthenus TaxID=7906 RepID=A0A444UX64_ACIRT|nr:Transmembrane protein 131 [Acipenser ruthenus]
MKSQLLYKHVIHGWARSAKGLLEVTALLKGVLQASSFIQSDTILEVLRFGDGSLLPTESDIGLNSYHQKSCGIAAMRSSQMSDETFVQLNKGARNPPTGIEGIRFLEGARNPPTGIEGIRFLEGARNPPTGIEGIRFLEGARHSTGIEGIRFLEGARNPTTGIEGIRFLEGARNPTLTAYYSYSKKRRQVCQNAQKHRREQEFENK